MPLNLTATARALSQQTNIEQQIILEIDGMPVIFGAIQITKFINYGDDVEYGDEGLVYGGLLKDPSQRDYISLEGTTYSVKQQQKPDKPSSNSVQKVTVNLVDKDGEVTRLFRPSENVNDVIGTNANVYVSFRGASHPEDSVKILAGKVDDLKYGAGNILVQVTHPDDLKRSEVYQSISDELTANIDNSVTTIPMASTVGIFEDQDAVETYVRINDEVIKVGSISGNDLIGCTRAQFGTIAASHDAEDEVKTLYTMEGTAIDLSLKILLSDPAKEFYAIGIKASSVNQVDAGINLANTIVFNGVDVERDYGLTVGDFVTTESSILSANNVALAPVASIVKTESGSYVVLSGVSTETELVTDLTASFKSKYNVLADGCKLNPSGVDVAQFESIKTLFSSSLPNYFFYIKDTLEAKKFIDEELLFPSGLIPMPRQGKVSLNITLPPLADNKTKTLNSDNVERPESIKIGRTTNQNFYNSIIYKFEEDILEDELTRGFTLFSQSSVNRIETRNKPLTIEAKGLRDNADTREKIRRQSRRFTDRFQFAAELVKVTTNYKTGLPIEIGDTTILNSDDLKIVNQAKATREDGGDRLFEVVDKSINIKTGKVNLNLLDTAFNTDARFGVIGPASYTSTGSTVSQLKIKTSFGTDTGQVEQDKWVDYLNQEIRVHSIDYTFDEITTLKTFQPGQPNTLNIDPPLSVAPPEDYIVDMPDYPFDEDDSLRRLWKQLHCFYDPQVTVVSGVSNTEFTVSPSDINKFTVGLPIRVHSDEYIVDSTDNLELEDAKVSSIDTGTNTVTATRDLGFTPSVGQKVELIGFIDEGQPYRYF